MANVSKKEFEALKDSINAWVAATSSLFDCHKNRAAALEARFAAAEKAGDKSIADLSARVDANTSLSNDVRDWQIRFHGDWGQKLRDVEARVDALARTVGVLAEKQSAARQTNDSVGRIAEDLEAPREKPVGSMPVDWVVRHVVWPSRYGHYFPEAWSILLHNNNSGQDSVVAVLNKEAKTVEQAIDIALESARV